MPTTDREAGREQGDNLVNLQGAPQVAAVESKRFLTCVLLEYLRLLKLSILHDLSYASKMVFRVECLPQLPAYAHMFGS